MAPFQREVIAALEARPPSVVLLSSGTSLDVFDGRSNAARIPLIHAYVERHYPRRIEQNGNVLALPQLDRR